MRSNAKIIVLLISAGLFVVFIQINQTDHKKVAVRTPDIVVACPTWQNHVTVLEEWSTEFDKNNPDAADGERREAWYTTLENNNCDRELPYCPTGPESFNAYWNNWSYDYITAFPDANVDTQMDAWNEMMLQNSCSEEWINPLNDLIEQQASSATPVYWHDDD